MILRNEEQDRQDMHSDLEHKIAANFAGQSIDASQNGKLILL
jgi:hypothetical protein